MLQVQQANQVFTVEARAGGDPAAENSNPIPAEMGSPTAPGGQDLIPARSSTPIALGGGNPNPVGDRIIPMGDGVIPVGDGVTPLGNAEFMGSRSGNPIGVGGGSLPGLWVGGPIVAGVEDPFAVTAGDNPAVEGNLWAARGGGPVAAEGETGWPWRAPGQGIATNIMPPRVPEVRQPPDLPCCHVMKSMLAATTAAQSLQQLPHLQLCHVCITTQMPVLCPCTHHAWQANVNQHSAYGLVQCARLHAIPDLHGCCMLPAPSPG